MAGIHAQEVRLGHEKTALKNAVAQQTVNAQVMIGRQRDPSAQSGLEHPFDGVFLAERGHFVFVRQQAPRIGCVRSRCVRVVAAKRKPCPFHRTSLETSC